MPHAAPPATIPAQPRRDQPRRDRPRRAQDRRAQDRWAQDRWAQDRWAQARWAQARRAQDRPSRPRSATPPRLRSTDQRSAPRLAVELVPAPGPLDADLDRIELTLDEAVRTSAPAERYLTAHLAALRTGALIIRLRSTQVPTPTHLWSLVASVAPEFQGWSSRFAAQDSRREAVRSDPTVTVSPGEADEVLADVVAFYRDLCDCLGVSDHPRRAVTGRSS